MCNFWQIFFGKKLLCSFTLQAARVKLQSIFFADNI